MFHMRTYVDTGDLFSLFFTLIVTIIIHFIQKRRDARIDADKKKEEEVYLYNSDEMPVNRHYSYNSDRTGSFINEQRSSENFAARNNPRSEFSKYVYYSSDYDDLDDQF
ncbi:MAG: hypothetical protein ACI376_03580 [Candidatus Bruticola sp.]